MIDRETADRLLEMGIDEANDYLERIENEQVRLVYIPIPPDYDPTDDIIFEEVGIEP